MKIIFIRHGKTNGNLEKRYIGKTDESLCEIGIKELEKNIYPKCDLVFSSSKNRCIQTANLIYKDISLNICDDLREYDFGDFEGKNYLELINNKDYINWLNSNCTSNIPNGEDFLKFKTRSCNAFKNIMNKYNGNITISFVVHGGTIMSIFEKFAVPKKNFYDFHVENGNGYITEYYNGRIYILQEIK
jgi:alpha-ribazole phosphatase